MYPSFCTDPSPIRTFQIPGLPGTCQGLEAGGDGDEWEVVLGGGNAWLASTPEGSALQETLRQPFSGQILQHAPHRTREYHMASPNLQGQDCEICST